MMDTQLFSTKNSRNGNEDQQEMCTFAVYLSNCVRERPSRESDDSPLPFIIDSIHYGALRPVMMDTVVLRVTTILSLLYACTCR